MSEVRGPDAARVPDKLRGVVERITYHSEETGYTVARLAAEGGTRPSFGASSYGASALETTIVGTLPDINVGEFVELTGRWTVHAEYGKQFQVETMRSVLPATVAGIEKYLGSGLIKGVGPVTAKRIVRRFGAQTLDVIEQTPERLLETPGVGEKRIRMIIEAWETQRAIKEVMLFLQSHGVTTGLATKIFKQYGEGAIGLVRQDPYRLARDIYGIGFLTADKIARSLGLAADSPQRVAAGAAYALDQAAEEGHVYLPATKLAEQAAELLGVPPQQAATGMVRMWEAGLVRVTESPGGEEITPLTQVANLRSRPGADGADEETPQLLASPGELISPMTLVEAEALLAEDRPVYLAPLYFSEKGAATRLRRILVEGEDRLEGFQNPAYAWERALEGATQSAGIVLAPQQAEAVRAALTHRLTVLTGGPGTGKTTTVRTILELCHRQRGRALLAAPTGRAAKRLAETTGQEAKTIHRLLEFKPMEGMAFQRNEDNPLEGDLLIVDEASMLDLALAHHLLRAIPPGMHLLLVGDIDQLPSVGAGNVLKDIIAAIEEAHVAQVGNLRNHELSVRAKVIRLQTIFRQAADSYIIANAHRINQGQTPHIDNERALDFFHFKTEEPERAAQLCVELVQSRIPRRFGIPSGDIQVLSPMHRGVAGVAALNEALQNALNPPLGEKPQRIMGNRVYRLGDRVMQIRNNYDKEVYNGDMGEIVAVEMELQQATVRIDGRSVVYDFLELDELVHAYAVSIHKSQGSEFPAVVIPLLTSHYMMLQRNLLYTAVSRARRLVVLVGQTKAMAMAVRNNEVATRFTGLRERLLGGVGNRE